MKKPCYNSHLKEGEYSDLGIMTKDTLNELPGVLIEALDEKMISDGRGNLVELHSNISKQEAKILYETVFEFSPQNSVEIGCAMGISSLAILKACEDNNKGLHTIIDPYQSTTWSNIGLTLIRKANLDQRMVFYERFPEEILPNLGEIDFGFIDGSHLFDYTMMDFVLIDKKLRVGGLIGFHDLWMPSLKSMLRFILNNRSYTLVSEVKKPKRIRKKIRRAFRRFVAKLPHSNKVFSGNFLQPFFLGEMGNLFLLRKDANDDRDWRYFVPF